MPRKPVPRYRRPPPDPGDDKIAPANLVERITKPNALKDDRQTRATLIMCGKMQLGVDSTASFLGVAPKTLRNTFERLPQLRELWDTAKEQGKALLRGKQYQMAMAGNVTMLIWLGKNILGQSDKIEHAGAAQPVDKREAREKLEKLLDGRAVSIGEAAASRAGQVSKRTH